MTARLTTSLRLDASLRKRIDRLAVARQRTAHWLMRRAIEDHVGREERRDQLRKDALAAWGDYRATGQHVTAQEADEWLAKLEAGEDAEPPECHA